MNTVRIYIDEELDISSLYGVKRLIQTIPHIHDVAVSDKELHEVMVDYEERQNMPVKLIETLRKNGLHPDILSA